MSEFVDAVLDTVKDTDTEIGMSVGDICTDMMKIYGRENDDGLRKTVERYTRWWEKDHPLCGNDAKSDILELFDFFAFLADMQVMKYMGIMPQNPKKNEWELYQITSECAYGPIRRYYRDIMEYKLPGDTWVFTDPEPDREAWKEAAKGFLESDKKPKTN